MEGDMMEGEQMDKESKWTEKDEQEYQADRKCQVGCVFGIAIFFVLLLILIVVYSCWMEDPKDHRDNDDGQAKDKPLTENSLLHFFKAHFKM